MTSKWLKFLGPMSRTQQQVCEGRLKGSSEKPQEPTGRPLVESILKTLPPQGSKGKRPLGPE